MSPNSRIQILLYTQQPFVAKGLAAVLSKRAGFRLAACSDNLPLTLEYLRTVQPHVLLVYLTARIGLGELRNLQVASGRAQIVLWGQDLAGEFAFQAMQLGVRSILPGDASVDGVLSTVENVHNGVLCFQKELMESVLLQKRVTLTRRQGQIVSLVSQGYKNKQIATSLGITEGTVKVYLYKLFKKLGLNDRLDMALYGLRNLYGGQAVLERIPLNQPRRIRAQEPFGPRSLPPRLRPHQPLRPAIVPCEMTG